MADKQENNHVDITLFKKAMEDMVAKNVKAWNESIGYSYSFRRTKEYTKEEVE